MSIEHRAYPADRPQRGRPTPPTVQLVRVLPGLIGESRRVVHAVRTDGQALSGVLAAVCGEQFVAVEVERLDEITGMPCEVCLALGPTPRETAARSARNVAER